MTGKIEIPNTYGTEFSAIEKTAIINGISESTTTKTILHIIYLIVWNNHKKVFFTSLTSYHNRSIFIISYGLAIWEWCSNTIKYIIICRKSIHKLHEKLVIKRTKKKNWKKNLPVWNTTNLQEVVRIREDVKKVSFKNKWWTSI